MNPGIFITGPKYFVLNMVEGYYLLVNAHDFLFPGAFDQAAQIFDGRDARIAAQNQFYGPGVIGICVEGKLFVARKSCRIHIFKNFEIPVQLRFFGFKPA